MISRRSFLKLLGLAPAAPVIPALAEFELKAKLLDTFPTKLIIQPENAEAAREILTSAFAKELWPGVKAYWDEVYK